MKLKEPGEGKSKELILSDLDLNKLRLSAAHPEMFRGNPGGSVMLSPEVFVKMVNIIDHFIAQNTTLENRLTQLRKEYALLKIKKRQKVESEFRFKLKELRISRRWSRQSLSEKTGISEAELKSWELGYALPTKEELENLTETFGLENDALKKYI